MCGFSGIITNYQNNIDKNFLSTLLNHRGPDMNGFYEDENSGFKLFFNRLSIQDLSKNGNQPFIYKNLVLVANCEIYNFKNIKSLLIDKYEFKSETDSEVLIYAYKEWGDKFLDYLEGMFSIVIYNKEDKSIKLFRDRFGIKPLYYFLDDGNFIFSSEFLPIVKILKKLNKVLNFNYQSINNFIYAGYNFESSTNIKNIYKVKPSHFISLKNFEIQEIKYWELKKNKKTFNFDESLSIIENQFNVTVKNHLISDVPISILLSGGLDSSLITYFSSLNENQENLSTITINMDNEISDSEKRNISFLKKNFSIKNEILNIESKNIIKDIEKNINVFDDLQSADAGYLTNNEIAKKLSNSNCKVVLVGDGSDEIFGGYSWFGLSKFPFSILNENIKNLIYFYAISRTINFLKIKKIFNKFNQNIKNISESYFDKICKNELFSQLPNNYLMKVDKPFMKNSIEARVPYLDHKFVENVYNISNNFKLKGKTYSFSSFKKPNEKFILRQVAKKKFTNEIFNTKKKGFSISTSKLINENKDLFFEVINDNKSYIGFEDKKKITDSLYKVKESKYNPILKNREIVLWKLFLFNIWKANV